MKPFVVNESALVAGEGTFDLVFLHGIGEGARSRDGKPQALNLVETRSPFRNQEARRLFRLIVPQLSNRRERWGDRRDDLIAFYNGLIASGGGRRRPLFLMGFSIGGCGVLEIVNAAGPSPLAVDAWCCVDAASPEGTPNPTRRALQIPHLIVNGPYGFRAADAIVVPRPKDVPADRYHPWVSHHVLENGAAITAGGTQNVYQWFAKLVARS